MQTGGRMETEMEHIAKVLIVDDRPENLQALEAIIRRDDRRVYHASSGEQALRLLLEHEFALAILDVQMPDMDGFELAELMRGTAKTRRIPIVFVSAATRERNYAFKGYETGAVDFLHKPLDVAAVTSKVNVFVSLYQQQVETRKQVEALQQSRAAQEILLNELHATQVELQRSLQMRDNFMSMVAHELRTPLNTLYLESQVRELQLARRNFDAFDEAGLTGMVSRDRRQIQSMIRLIDDMLDVSRLRNDKLSIRREPVDLSALIARVVGDLAHQAAAMGCDIAVNAAEGVIGYWDAFRIEQVVVNLISNALRYGQRKPIEVVLREDPAGYACIDVTDRGAGVAEADHDRIFEPFERGHSGNASAGLGLGLYIARQLVHAHGGEISLRSAPEAGATFCVKLPIDQATRSAVGKMKDTESPLPQSPSA